ncbi:MAG: sulfatase-like hydrolase/transferase [Bacteroidales bacterium]|nr:sulfatase-like hydrolase/transferase [Bacteroidales bacterium]
MKRLFFSLIRQYLFWMIFFFLLRAVFLIYHINLLKLEDITTGEALLSFWHGLKLDTATAAYILIIPSLFLLIQGLFKARWLNTVNKVYTFILILVWSLITAVELGSFAEWKCKLSTSAFAHVKHISEAYYSISAEQFFSLLFFLVVMTGSSFILYSKVFYMKILERSRLIYSSVVFFIVAVPLLFVLLRGGINDIAISQSSAHYSHHSILNWAAVNSGYQFAVNVMETSRYKKSNAYQFYDLKDARKTVEDILRTEKDTTISILNSSRPNIVILLMESWTADIIESLGARPGITPEFAKLEKEGLLFTRFYSTGNRSHEAAATIFGGHPALPYTTFTANPEKFRKMPSMVKTLNAAGYNTSFYFGGQLDYGNMRAYLLFNQFEKMFEEADIDPSIPRGRLGVHDEYLYRIHIDEMKDAKEPFFSVVFTLSSHSPYDFPMDPVLDWAGPENPFINSAYYADKCLGEYFEMARKQPWFDNTLFIIIADHGHNSYMNWRYESYEYHRIPLFFYGNVLKDEFRGVKSDRISDNSCLTKTILKQLNLPADEFNWGDNLFNPYAPEYAYIVLNDGYTWKSPEGEIVYSMNWNHYYKKDFPEGTTPEKEEAFIRKGESYVQVLFQDFLDL